MVCNQVSSSRGWGVITRLPVKRLGNKLCVSEGIPWTYIYIYIYIYIIIYTIYMEMLQISLFFPQKSVVLIMSGIKNMLFVPENAMFFSLKSYMAF